MLLWAVELWKRIHTQVQPSSSCRSLQIVVTQSLAAAKQNHGTSGSTGYHDCSCHRGTEIRKQEAWENGKFHFPNTPFLQISSGHNPHIYYLPGRFLCKKHTWSVGHCFWRPTPVAEIKYKPVYIAHSLCRAFRTACWQCCLMEMAE